MNHRRRYILCAPLVALSLAFLAPQAQGQAAPPIPGVKGKIVKVTSTEQIQGPKGLEHVKIKEPLTTYGREASDLSHVTSDSFVGVTSVKQPDGKEQAKEIHIFPKELRGAGEGSNMMDQHMMDQASHSRMTNGSVSRSGGKSGSRMTNGTVQKQGSGTTIVVHYQNGSQIITVPPDVAVTQIVPKKQKLEPGDTVYAATEKGSDGKLTTDKVYVIAGEAGSTTASK